MSNKTDVNESRTFAKQIIVMIISGLLVFKVSTSLANTWNNKLMIALQSALNYMGIVPNADITVMGGLAAVIMVVMANMMFAFIGISLSVIGFEISLLILGKLLGCSFSIGIFDKMSIKKDE